MVVVFEDEIALEVPGASVAYWSSFVQSGPDDLGVYSLPSLIQDHPEESMHRYLRWLDYVRLETVGQGSLETSMQIRSDLSYWWMTIPTLYAFSTSSLAYQVLRLMSLIDLCKELKVNKLILISPPPTVEDVLRRWAPLNGVELNIRQSRRKTIKNRLHRTATTLGLMLPIAYLTTLVYFMKVRPRCGSAKPAIEPLANSVGISMVDYLQIDSRGVKKSRNYESPYWGCLPEVLDAHGIPVSWVHLALGRHSGRRNCDEAAGNLNLGAPTQSHRILQRNLSLTCWMRTLRTYRSIRAMRKQGQLPNLWRDRETTLDFWPLVRSGWIKSLAGSLAAENASWICRFEELAKTLNDGLPCGYLMENQPWELALLSALRSKGIMAFGVQHALVRDFDTRYALGTAEAQFVGSRLLPRPNFILTNGPSSRATLSAFGWPHDRLVAVEALRFGHLEDSPTRIHKSPGAEDLPRSLLVMGEYDSGLTKGLLDLLGDLDRMKPQTVRAIFQPHPAGERLRNKRRVTLPQPRPTVGFSDHQETEATLCSSVSGSSLEALLAGRICLVYRDPSVLDGRHALVRSKAVGIISPLDLAEAIENLHRPDESIRITGDQVFTFGADLDLWLSWMKRWREFV